MYRHSKNNFSQDGYSYASLVKMIRKEEKRGHIAFPGTLTPSLGTYNGPISLPSFQILHTKQGSNMNNSKYHSQIIFMQSADICEDSVKNICI